MTSSRCRTSYPPSLPLPGSRIWSKVKKGYQIGDRMFRVHMDGINMLPFLGGEQEQCPREGFVYWSDDGDLLALRVRRWKVVFRRTAPHRDGGVARTFLASAVAESF